LFAFEQGCAESRVTAVVGWLLVGIVRVWRHIARQVAARVEVVVMHVLIVRRGT